MKALVVCPTYGRLPFLGRLLASFLSQTYANKALVFINDDKNIKLECNYDNVFCINLDKKILVPDKRNIGVSLGKYDVYFNLDDDDVFLPSRIANKINHHKREGIESTHDKVSYVFYDNSFENTKSRDNDIRMVPYGVCSFTRELFYYVGGFLSDKNFGEDKVFFDSIYKLDSHMNIESDMDFIYSWTSHSYHSTREYTKEYTNKIDKIAYEQVIEMGLKNSTFNIKPDFETFSKFIKLEKLFNLNKIPVKLKHTSISTFDIVDFEN